LHYWVFGGPWSYDEEPIGEPTEAELSLGATASYVP
jgi:hypothetical protein